MPKPQLVRPIAKPRTETVSDIAEREAALRIDSSWIVEAPAGSGKTGLLMQRFLKLLASPNTTQPEEVLAATFTNKATAELRERVLRELQRAYSLPRDESLNDFASSTRALAAAVLSRDAERDWCLLARPQRLNIRTIDSLCAEIARTLPLLSGSGAPRTPSADPKELYRLAAQRTLLQLGGNDAVLNTSLEAVLLHRDGDMRDCETLIARMLEFREQWGELIPLSPGEREDAVLETETRPRLERALESIVCAGLTRATRAMPPGFLAQLTLLASELSGVEGYLGNASPVAICAGRTSPPGEKAEHLEHWLVLLDLLLVSGGTWRKSFNANHLGFKLPATHKGRLEALIDSVAHDDALRDALCALRKLPPAHYPDEQWQVAKALFHLLVRALAELKIIFSERETCDFAELSLAARHALADAAGPGDYASALGSTLQHLLVDEMQDTSAAQYDLIERLTASWDGHTQTLFLVGDPKQSIYSFRQARVERFLRTRREKRLGTVPLGALNLTANFRSQARLVDNFNSAFSLIFPASTASEQVEPTGTPEVPFIHAVATRAEDPDPKRETCWHTTVIGEDAATRDAKDPKQAHAEEEARCIRSVIEEWQRRDLPADRKLGKDGKPEPWKIAVLGRARKHLTAIVKELQSSADGRTPIAFRALKIETLEQRAEVLDVLALTRALLHPADRTAWLAVLHAPWCGLGLADLLALAGGGVREEAKQSLPAHIESRRSLLSDDAQQLLDRAWPVLSAALAQRGRSTLATLVERTWRSLGGDAPLDAVQQKNVALYFTLLRELEEPGARVDLDRLAARMEDLYAQPQTATNAIDILTMHGAKGLEWDVVLLPGLEHRGQFANTHLLNWLELDAPADTEAGVILAPINGRGEDSDNLIKWLHSVRNAREAAERKRLFYVACTRAREELHLFAAPTRKVNGELCVESNSLLQAAWPAAEPHFASFASAPAAPKTLVVSLGNSLTASLHRDEDEPLAMAASGDEVEEGSSNSEQMKEAPPPRLRRLPLSFQPRDRFTSQTTRLPYPAASAAPLTLFVRPEGSYEARALGNVVHRYLQLLSERLAVTEVDTLDKEVEGWTPRLTASLRAEGLPLAAVKRAASIARRALAQTLADPVGLWLLSPNAAAANERSLRFAAENAAGLRVDRSFIAGAAPFDPTDSHVWIVDFKTSAQSTAVSFDFDEVERSKYGPQLETYARAQRGLLADTRPVMLALYYPLLPRFIAWPAEF